jgi:enamine deaminase RidA (YjgF/YER057c/UK114 family)
MPACEAAIEWLEVDCSGLAASAGLARYGGADGTNEWHITVRPTGEGSATKQLDALAAAYRRALETAGIEASSVVFRRMFCSDVANQRALVDGPALDLLLGASGPCADSVIGQAPLSAAKFALWAYHLRDADGDVKKRKEGQTVTCMRGAQAHHWATGLVAPGGACAHEQSQRIMEGYESMLGGLRMNTADHVVRTWWFVKNIDADYQGLVDARNDFFDTHGLTPETHYLASTGIAGSHPDVAAKVALDSYAISGLLPEQVRYLCAPGHLCPTHDYGVAFERATAVSYADRKHVFLSGTASIDSSGEIVHEGDVVGQFNRTLENIEALLATVDAHIGDLASILVYLRDPADGVMIEELLRDRLGGVPFVLVDAPVCRPGWLIEIEGIAIVPAACPELPRF